MPVFFKPPEVATALRIGRRTVYRKIASGEIRAVRVGSGSHAPLRIPSSELARAVRRA
jgi:excisionase family DNA binding protein